MIEQLKRTRENSSKQKWDDGMLNNVQKSVDTDVSKGF